MTTQFITTMHERHDAEFPNSYEKKTTTVIGDLADRVRKVVGYRLTDEVQIIEYGEEGGYSEYTVEWTWDFEVRVAGDLVFSTACAWTRADLTDDDRAPHPTNGMGKFFEWLRENEVPRG